MAQLRGCRPQRPRRHGQWPQQPLRPVGADARVVHGRLAGAWARAGGQPYGRSGCCHQWLAHRCEAWGCQLCVHRGGCWPGRRLRVRFPGLHLLHPHCCAAEHGAAPAACPLGWHARGAGVPLAAVAEHEGAELGRHRPGGRWQIHAHQHAAGPEGAGHRRRACGRGPHDQASEPLQLHGRRGGPHAQHGPPLGPSRCRDQGLASWDLRPRRRAPALRRRDLRDLRRLLRGRGGAD
mmetsp:Transcript_92793/g.276823  ORF Transcript_92793/g.276823 Transcript_92793/m.276823 type:complete len:236 (+) Transcript_92793:210-917(+)